MDHDDSPDTGRRAARTHAPAGVEFPHSTSQVSVAPIDADGVRTAQIGTGLWAIALLALLPFSGWLAETGRTWWLWTCFAGIGLGLLGIDHCQKRRDRARATADAAAQAIDSAPVGRRRR